jgi:hypothetical protein
MQNNTISAPAVNERIKNLQSDVVKLSPILDLTSFLSTREEEVKQSLTER